MIKKKPTHIDLHGPAVHLPELQLVTPGPLPTLSLTKEKKTTKVKKSTGGLCASCFGTKSAARKSKEVVAEPVPVPIKLEKTIEKEEKKDLSPIVEVPSVPSTTTTDWNRPHLELISIYLKNEIFKTVLRYNESLWKYHLRDKSAFVFLDFFQKTRRSISNHS